MRKKSKRQGMKMIKLCIVPVALCIIIMLSIIIIVTPKFDKTAYELQVRKMNAEQGYEAQIGEGDDAIAYSTLEEAIEHANENDKIILLSDTTIDTSLTISKNLSIDLNELILYTNAIVNNSQFKLSNGSVCGINSTGEMQECKIKNDYGSKLTIENTILNGKINNGTPRFIHGR